MKALTTSLASLLAIAFVSTASAAPVVIHIAGSNGDRAVTNAAIERLLVGATFAGTKTPSTSANQGTWSGGTFNGTAVTVKVSFIGATGGIAALAGSLPVRFLPNGATGTSLPDPTVDPNPYEASVPDFALSTNFQSTSPFSGVYQGHTYTDLTDTLTSIIGLKWVASKGFPSDNISPQQAQLLWSNGRAPLSYFTGNPADVNTIVYATGRNTDAGQRWAAQAESGIGINANVVQYKPTISGAAAGVGGYVTGGTATLHQLWPIETYSGVSSQFLGNSGATTGANLAPYLTVVLGPDAYKYKHPQDETKPYNASTNPYVYEYPNATGGYYISYLTPGDANTIAIPNGAKELKWNGISFSNTAVEQGQYTFWVYEHVLYKPNFSGVAKTFGDALIANIQAQPSSDAGISLNDVQVQRLYEGGPVLLTNF